MTAIARHGGLPYPTAFRIVQTLLHEGLIEQEPIRKHYRPTALVTSLALGYRDEARLSDIAHAHMSEFTRRWGWPLFLSVRVGVRMVIRDSTHDETSLTFDPCYPGHTIPLVTSATGHALLSTMAQEDVAKLIGWAAQEIPETRTIAAESLHAAVEQVRLSGYAGRPCASGTRTSSLAVPIPADVQPAQAVLTMTYFTSAMKPHIAAERFAEALQSTAADVAAALREDALATTA